MISVILTGGTIGSAPNHGQRLAPSAPSDSYAAIRRIAHTLNLKIEVMAWQDSQGNPTPPIDSCDITPAHWLQLGEMLATLDRKTDGIIILHGTDTMAYTAAALGFLDRNSNTPVILTGAQIPLSQPASDAPKNIQLAMQAARGDFGDMTGEVVIAFDNKLLKGTRTTKASSLSKNAFTSPNAPAIHPGLGPTENEATLAEWRTAKKKVESFSHTEITNFSTRIAAITVTPAFDPALLLNMRQIDGLVLSLFGMGTAPNAAALLEVIADLAADRILCVGRTACSHGQIDWGRYAASLAFEDSDLINAQDMTLEATSVKLMAAIGMGLPPKAAKDFFSTNLAGEISPERDRMTCP